MVHLSVSLLQFLCDPQYIIGRFQFTDLQIRRTRSEESYPLSDTDFNDEILDSKSESHVIKG